MKQTNSPQRLPDLRILGDGSAGGGSFRRVVIRGNGTVTGDLVCEQIKAMGNVTVQGDIRADHVRVTGNLHVTGDLRANEIRVTGMMQASGDVSAELCRCSGTFQIDGLLNAERLDVRLYGPSSAREIGGGVIVIRPMPRWPWAAAYKELTAESIEGDELKLTHVRARIVRGKRVRVGKGADIETVEYQERLEVSPDARVLDQRKV